MFELHMEKLTALLQRENLSLGEYTLRCEMEQSGKSRAQVMARMEGMLGVMRQAAAEATERPVHSVSGLTGGDAYRYNMYRQGGKSICGPVMSAAVAMALSGSEMNASMSRIVACPTAGSCGIVPAALLAVAQERHKTQEELLLSLFTAAGIGIVIGSRATVAGAEGGCQAECGAAAAMAAAGVTELLGGSADQAFHAAAMALKNEMGLVCDPVAGLVEIPCIKRNAAGAALAILSADLALAGVQSRIPFGEVVDAMREVGEAMSDSLKETAQGGLAATPTGRRLQQQVTAASQTISQGLIADMIIEESRSL